MIGGEKCKNPLNSSLSFFINHFFIWLKRIRLKDWSHKKEYLAVRNWWAKIEVNIFALQIALGASLRVDVDWIVVQ